MDDIDSQIQELRLWYVNGCTLPALTLARLCGLTHPAILDLRDLTKEWNPRRETIRKLTKLRRRILGGHVPGVSADMPDAAA